MAENRRTFVKQVVSGAIGGWLLTTLPATARGRYIISSEEMVDANDEDFWKAVRDQFPLTHERAYLNNGTIGPSPYVVRDAVKSAIDNVDFSGDYGGGEESRGKIAKFVNADEAEISFTHNVTEGINIVAWGMPLKAGDEVIMTTQEHVGNALPWLNRQKYDGIVIKTFTPAMTAAENLNRINDLITPRTRALAIPHITCTIGQVFPVKEMAKLGRDKGLFIYFDGAHGPGMTMLDLKDIDCDFYATCAHKWMCGPKGTAFLYVKKDMLDTLGAKFVGGYSGDFDMTTNPPIFKGYVPTAHRYDYGTQSAALFIGMGAAVDFLYHIGMENIVKRGRALSTYLQQELLKLGDKVEMLTPTEERSRGFVTGFRLKNMPYDKFGELATKNGFRIRLVPESHLNSIRISTHIYNNYDELNKFVDLVKTV